MATHIEGSLTLCIADASACHAGWRLLLLLLPHQKRLLLLLLHQKRLLLLLLLRLRLGELLQWGNQSFQTNCAVSKAIAGA
jgi:hypothetical protein